MKQTEAKIWDDIWARRNLGSLIIDLGRNVYNFFFARVLRRYLGSQSRMLEIGCGSSTLSLSLAKDIRELVGVDISPEALERSGREALGRGVTNALFVLGDCRNLALNPHFDFVWSQGLIEHFDNPGEIVTEHYRMLAPGGTALLSVPYKYSYHTLWYKLTRPKSLRFLWPWTDQVFFSKTELLKLGKDATQNSQVFFLHPLALGIVMLEMRKPLDIVK